MQTVDPLLIKMDNLIALVDAALHNNTKSQIQSQQTSKKKRKYQNPKDIQLLPTPDLPMVKVHLPWLNSPVSMKALMFYGSKPNHFACQFSNLFYSPFKCDTKYIIPTKDKSIQTILNYHKYNLPSNIDDIKEEIIEFQSSENVFQSAKAEHKSDCDFVCSLSPGDSARAGQNRLNMNNGLANKYKKYGGNPYKIKGNKWQFNKDSNSYKRRDKWHIYKIEIMMYALREKFKQYPYLIEEYVDCDTPIFFIEHTKNDEQWADKYNGDGTNYLGKLLTALCWDLRLRKQSNIVNDKIWNIDTTTDNFLKWLKLKNMDVIENGLEFYSSYKCTWC